MGAATEENLARFGTAPERNAHADELDGMVAAWVAALDATDLLAALVDARVPAVRVNDVAALLADPHIRARGSIELVDDDEVGARFMPAPTPHFSRTPSRITVSGPALGADTDDVVREWLGEP
jgi:crotonobetainyl-CoA:carnitine CoA-transferase CaiB-like acyl-CoA transferase